LLAPDGSEIRLLGGVDGASLVHCRLPPGQVTQAVRHRTVEEVWYCIGGVGEVWRQAGAHSEIVELKASVSVTIPLGVEFQFRSTGAVALELVIATAPPWPGADEAIAVDGIWAR
jgi:mannose-6-phosphate isomerase-like protein (cupin superfamily)